MLLTPVVPVSRRRTGVLLPRPDQILHMARRRVRSGKSFCPNERGWSRENGAADAAAAVAEDVGAEEANAEQRPRPQHHHPNAGCPERGGVNQKAR